MRYLTLIIYSMGILGSCIGALSNGEIEALTIVAWGTIAFMIFHIGVTGGLKE